MLVNISSKNKIIVKKVRMKSPQMDKQMVNLLIHLLSQFLWFPLHPFSDVLIVDLQKLLN